MARALPARVTLRVGPPETIQGGMAKLDSRPRRVLQFVRDDGFRAGRGKLRRRARGSTRRRRMTRARGSSRCDKPDARARIASLADDHSGVCNTVGVPFMLMLLLMWLSP